MHKHECSPPPALQCLVSAIANTWRSQHSLQTKWHAVLPAVCSVFVCSLLALHISAKCLPTYFPHVLHVVLPAHVHGSACVFFICSGAHRWVIVRSAQQPVRRGVRHNTYTARQKKHKVRQKQTSAKATKKCIITSLGVEDYNIWSSKATVLEELDQDPTQSKQRMDRSCL